MTAMKKIRRKFLLTSRVRSATAMIVSVLALVTIAVFAQTASVAGTWTGAIETPAVRLGIVVRLQAGDTGHGTEP